MSDEMNRNQEMIPWTKLDIFLIFIIASGAVMIVGEILVMLLQNTAFIETETLESVVVLCATLIQNILLFSLCYLFLRVKYNYSLRRLFSFENKIRIVVNGIVGGFLIFFGVMVINLIMAVILLNVFHIIPPQQEVITLLLESNNLWLFLSYAILIVVIAPIVEETFFRGLIYSFIRSKYGVFKGLLVSGMIFGLAHQSLWAFVGTTLGGIGLAYLYEKSKSLYTSILAHMVWNGIVTFSLYLYWILN